MLCPYQYKVAHPHPYSDGFHFAVALALRRMLLAEKTWTVHQIQVDHQDYSFGYVADMAHQSQPNQHLQE